MKDKVEQLNWKSDVTLKNVDDFRKALLSLSDSQKTKLILNLTEVSYLNSAALGVIADAVLSAGRANKEILIGGVQATVSEIFEIVHFRTLMKIFPDINEAYAYCKGEE